MEEIDNLSIESFSTLNSIDSETTDNRLTQNESTDKESTAKELNDNNDNQQSKTESINLNSIDDESNKSANLKNEKPKLIDNLLCKDKWIFKYDWNFRSELLKLFDEYTKLLITNKEISINKKKSFEKTKNDLIKLLNESPLKLDEESHFYEICINFDYNFRNQIIEQLLKNENLIYYKNKIDTNLKSKLIEENNHLIHQIIDLPVEHLNDDVNLVDGDDELESRQSECKDEKLVNKLEIELSNLKKETINLKEEISKLKSKSDDGNSIKLCCVKKDMKKFFENENDFISGGITHFNIEWYIRICSKYFDCEKKKYLQFWLYAINRIDDKNNVKWKCTTSFDLILKNNLPDKEDKIVKYNYTFNKSVGYGWHKFISEDELFNLDNGYMQDDTIKLEVNLKVGRVERIFE